MFKNKRKTIGVFLSGIGSEYQNHLCIGIQKRAKELDFNLAFFVNYGGYGQDKYEAGEKLILELPCYEKLDGIIVALDTMPINGMDDELKNKIKKYAHCPVISVRQYDEDYNNIIVDNNIILEELIEHFIEVHKMTRINFVTGKMDMLDAKQRLGTYKRVLKEHNIPVEEKRIFYGDYWKEKPRKAVRIFFDGVKREEWPQAIVCSNDYMAIAITDELEKNGILVPQDVSVSGCDNVDGAISNIPSITTVEINVELMGAMAVDKIFKYCQGESIDKISFSPVMTHYRESCGCEKYTNDTELRRKNVRFMNQLLNYYDDLSYMTSDMTKATSRDGIRDTVRGYISLLHNYDEFYMCLNYDWIEENLENVRDISAYSDHLILEAAVIDGKQLAQVEFDRKDILPPMAIHDKPLSFLFSPLHYQKRNFGYAAICYKEICEISAIYQSWLINIENMLENVRLNVERNRLLQRLENMYIRDELTGLYNRRGLNRLWTEHKTKCIEEKKKIMVICADLDDLKVINDSNGHSAGDHAIKRIAKAMENASKNDEIVARCGGDEFTIVGMVENEAEMERYMEAVQDELAKLNQEEDTVYKVSVSMGGSINSPLDSIRLEDCMNASDSKMYEQKYRKKAFRYRMMN